MMTTVYRTPIYSTSIFKELILYGIMGILQEGVPLSWDETKALADHVRQHGVQQFINLYRKSKDREGDPFKWGDEIEYMIVKFDDNKKEAKVACKSAELLQILNEKENNNEVQGLWRPEFGAYLIESSPIKPFEGPLSHFKTVETDMRLRRQEVQELLEEDECVMTLFNSLRFGCKGFTYPESSPTPDAPNSFTKSLYLPDEAIYSVHLRYHVITRNIRMRRGEALQVKIKVFKDENTKLPIENSPAEEPDVVMLDTTFGNNLQVTVQGKNMNEARYLYDQLAPLCPIIQAITANAPIYRGYLTDSDNSWNFIGPGSDDRTHEERGLKPLKYDKYRLTKNRWDSIDCYLTPEAEIYNDIQLDYDEKAYKHLRNEGVDHVMAQHIAHLFIRDPVLLFSGNIHQNDEEETGHFDNINTSTWQTLRFKPALPNTDAGWRVEFRPCDVQLTDFENAAVSCFVILLTRVIIYYQLNFLIPISKIDENMLIAQKKDAARKEKFWFRKNITNSQKLGNGFSSNGSAENGYTNGHTNGNTTIPTTNGYNCNNGHIEQLNGNINGYSNNGDKNGTNNGGTNGTSNGSTNGGTNGTNNSGTNGTNGYHGSDNEEERNGFTNGQTNDINKYLSKECEFMTVNEIFNGKSDSFPGLIPLTRSYLKSLELDNETQCLIDKYLKFIERRASGELLTNAMWLRQQVLNHPEYKKDSVVSERINYDILKKIQKMQLNESMDS